MSQTTDTHELVQALKDLALELGRTPTRAEFCAKVAGGNYRLSKFGPFATLLQAAGLETYDERRQQSKKRFTREAVFGADIVETVAAHVPRVVDSRPEDFKPILVIGDTHFPFVHKPTLEKIYRFAESELGKTPGYIVQVGDLMDQFAHSRFPASRSIYRPDEEMQLGRDMAEEFWKTLQAAAPGSQCYQIMGNHDVRALKLILSAAPTLESLIKDSISKLYEFENVTTISDYREELVIQDVMFHHGYMTRPGQARDHVMQNIATGHTHRGGVYYRALRDRVIWHLDAGYCGDPESKALSYTAQKTTGWTLGFGFIDQYGPRFIPA